MLSSNFSISSLGSFDICYCELQSDMFTITPNPTKIQPNATETFTVEFKPMILLNYKVHLISFVNKLSPCCEPLDILIRANTLMPKYHFDLSPSDYLKTRRFEIKKVCGSTDFDKANVRVIEFEAVGLKIPVMK